MYGQVTPFLDSTTAITGLSINIGSPIGPRNCLANLLSFLRVGFMVAWPAFVAEIAPVVSGPLDHLLGIAILIPVLAMLGIMNAGWNTAMRAALEPGFSEAHGPPRPGGHEALDSAFLAAPWWRLQFSYVFLIGLVFALRFGRDRDAAKLRSISLNYQPGRTITVPQGFSILEASRWANIPHTSICGGRARCSTCRVRIVKGNEYLPAPAVAEFMTLNRIKAGDSVRLACQTRPFGPVSVVPLVPAERGPPAGLRVSFLEGKELLVTALFADLRDSTQIAAGRLPYDSLFIIDRYIQVTTSAIRRHGGYVTHVAGDGVMSFFGANGDARMGARSALESAAALLDAIAALSEILPASSESH
jgi:adenylate cyclase